MYTYLFFLLLGTVVSKNIVYIVVDDLRINSEEIHTPNIDRLSQESYNFNNAYYIFLGQQTNGNQNFRSYKSHKPFNNIEKQVI